LHPHTTTVNTVFGGGDNTTLLKTVLTGGDAGKAEIVAAYLSILAGRIPPTILQLPEVQHMWTEYGATKGYSPRSGAYWNAEELVDYLKRLNSN
jgi:hypothetical protein